MFVIVQKHNEVKGKKIYRYIREVNGDTCAFKKDLLEQHWEHVCNENEINSAYDKFIKIFMFLYDKNCPVKKICINENRDRHQWFTYGLEMLVIRKTHCIKIFWKKRTFESELKYKNYKYIDFNNEVQ